MSVPNRFILHQAPVLASMGRAAFAAWARRGRKGAPTELPGPEICERVRPRAKDLVRAYVRNVGGDPSAYRRELPPHLFPQWGFPLASRALAEVDYPLQKVLNAGCRLEINAPLPIGETLNASARLVEIDDNGRRALLKQRVVTGTAEHPEALVAEMVALVPLSRGGGDGKKRERVRVPEDAREIAFWSLRADAGLEYAKLTGDFNPVHWLPAYARAFGFRNCILHGFATMARAYEGLVRGLYSGDTHAIRSIDVRFTKPLLLPAKVGLYVCDDQRIFVGAGPGGAAYLSGEYK